MDKPRQEILNTPSKQAQPGCAQCVSPDPQVRSAHQLTLAHDGLDTLRSHLHQYYAQTRTAEERQQYIDSVCGWVAGEMGVWSGYADAQTGGTLSWWEARRMAHSQQALGLAGAVAARRPGEEVD